MRFIFSSCPWSETLTDGHRLEQVLNNLLGNVIKYSPDANQVIVNSKVIADTIIVSVQDFGIGIQRTS